MKKLLGLFICICVGILASAGTVQAATPRVMVSDYSVKEGVVTSGKEFTLTITLKNTAAKAVKNIKLSISTENGELLPAKGAGTAYVDQIDADSEEKLTFKMIAAKGLEEKAYKLSLKTEYESSAGMGYTVDEAVFIPISLEQRLSITDFSLGGEFRDFELGETVEVCAVVNNLGEGMLYNVTAKVQGDNLQEVETYIGNIESGKSDTVDVLTKAIAVSESDQIKNYIYISYEDREGNVYQEKQDIGIGITVPVYKDLEKVKENKDYSDIVKKAVKVIILIALILGVILFFVRRKKRKQQLLDEFVK